ncbi:transposase [Bacteroidales bacterium]|nr:transposase [Bacteroidales bacterium]
MRKRLSSELKAKVAIAAIQGHRTVNEIASEYEVLPSQVSGWKKQYLDGAASIFISTQKANKSKESDQLLTSLYTKIGELEVERDFLKKKWQKMGGQ